jgi:hypothetical protein
VCLLGQGAADPLKGLASLLVIVSRLSVVTAYCSSKLSTIKLIQAEALAWIVRFLRASAWIVGANKLRS